MACRSLRPLAFAPRSSICSAARSVRGPRGPRWSLPLSSRSIATYAGVPLAPLVIAAVFVLVLRRAGEAAAAPTPGEKADRHDAARGVARREAQTALSRAGQTVIDTA